eukprot:m51a1_g1555 putative sterol o-acyltransferase 1 (376) ;mRNA; f:14297-15636
MLHRHPPKPDARPAVGTPLAQRVLAHSSSSSSRAVKPPRTPPQVLTPPTSPSVSILDANQARMPIFIGLITSVCWLVEVYFDAWVGGRLGPEFDLLTRSFPWRVVLLVLCLNACVALSTFAYSWAMPLASRRAGWAACVAVYVVGQATALLAPPLALAALVPNYSPAMGLAVALHGAAFIMKAHSYFFVCMSDRSAVCSARQYGLYLLFPTVTYVPRCAFARTARVRWGYFVWMSCCSLLLILILYTIFNHTIVPLLLEYPHTGFLQLWVRLLLPCQCGWLVFFYGAFHCWLNMVSEICMFGNRDFYQNWWESIDYSEWIRRWNSTVQFWVGNQYVYLYKGLGLPRFFSLFIIIFLSAGSVHSHYLKPLSMAHSF